MEDFTGSSHLRFYVNSSWFTGNKMLRRCETEGMESCLLYASCRSCMNLWRKMVNKKKEVIERLLNSYADTSFTRSNTWNHRGHFQCKLLRSYWAFVRDVLFCWVCIWVLDSLRILLASTRKMVDTSVDESFILMAALRNPFLTLCYLFWKFSPV